MPPAATLVAVGLILYGLLPHLLSGYYYTFAVALGTFVRVTIRRPWSFAFRTNYLFILLEFKFTALINVFKWYSVLELFGLALTEAAAAAETAEVISSSEKAAEYRLNVLATSLIAF